jgi:hypothetical protein
MTNMESVSIRTKPSFSLVYITNVYFDYHRMKLITLIAIVFVFFRIEIISAQELRPEIMKPGRTVMPVEPKSYADSAEFVKLFNEHYPDIKPALSVRAQAEEDFRSVSRTFAMQGIDSAEAAKVAFKNLDENAFYKIYFETFRRNLSAQELKKYIDFVSTPEGKHIIEVLPTLQHVLSDANMYVIRTMNANLLPIRQAAREKMEKEHPPLKNGSPVQRGGVQIPPTLPAKNINIFDQKNAASQDSLLNIKHRQKKIPPVKIPDDNH